VSSRVERAIVARADGAGTTYRPIPLADVGLGLRILADLLDAGMPAHRALRALGELAPDRWREALPSIEGGVRQGRGIAAAFGAVDGALPPIVIGVVRAGEAGGALSAAVRRAAEIVEAAAATRAAILGALAYPALLTAAGAASVGVLVLVVLPRFAAILGDIGQPLPRSTMFVLSAAAFVKAAIVPAIIAGMIAAVAWRAWTSRDEGRRRWDDIVLALPLIGAVRFASATSRACAALAALIDSGMPVAAALPFAGRATGNASLTARFADARTILTRGTGVATALAESSAVTPAAIRLVRAGEESGRLSGMLHHAAAIERDRAGRLTRACVRTIEPVLILFFGAVVALVAGSLLQAVYSVRPS